MSQTASGFLRVALLVIATSALALVWTGDQQAQQQYIAARKAAGENTPGHLLAESAVRPPAPSLPLPARTRSSSRPHHRTAVAAATVDSPAENTYVARVEIAMSLPVGIIPGRYQVVNQSGAVQTILVRSAPWRNETRDVYSLTRPDGTREFFIRLNEQTASAADRFTR